MIDATASQASQRGGDPLQKPANTVQSPVNAEVATIGTTRYFWNLIKGMPPTNLRI